MPTPAKVGAWLRSNDGNLPDAYKAVGYEGPPLKIKEGNLSTKRSDIRVAKRGNNGDTSRRAAERLNPPQNKQEENQVRRQNYKRSSLRKQGKNVVIDHHHELDLLAQTVDGMSPEEARATFKRLEESYGPLGNRPGNRRLVGARFNELKRQDSQMLQKYLGQMQIRPQTNGFMNGLNAAIPDAIEVIPMLDELFGNPVDRAIGTGVNKVREMVGLKPQSLPNGEINPTVAQGLELLKKFHSNGRKAVEANGISTI